MRTAQASAHFDAVLRAQPACLTQAEKGMPS
jgi:hypothetical protein